MKIENGTTTTLAYRLTTPDGLIVEQVLSDEPLRYLQGSRLLLDEIEAAIEGRSVGDTVMIELKPPARPSRSATEPVDVHVSRLPRDFVPRVGAAIGAGDPPDSTVLWVRAIHGDHVTLDPEDSLEGCSLTLQVWILDIDPSSDGT